MNKDTDTFDPELFNIRNFGMPTRQHQKDWGFFLLRSTFKF